MFASHLSNNLKIAASSSKSSANHAALTVSRSLSTAMSNASINSTGEEREVVTFLGLNNLGDNPGAVKKVCYILVDSFFSLFDVVYFLKMMC